MLVCLLLPDTFSVLPLPSALGTHQASHSTTGFLTAITCTYSATAKATTTTTAATAGIICRAAVALCPLVLCRPRIAAAAAPDACTGTVG